MWCVNQVEKFYYQKRESDADMKQAIGVETWSKREIHEKLATLP
jgi:hypothetical protein